MVVLDGAIQDLLSPPLFSVSSGTSDPLIYIVHASPVDQRDGLLVAGGGRHKEARARVRDHRLPPPVHVGQAARDLGQDLPLRAEEYLAHGDLPQRVQEEIP